MDGFVLILAIIVFSVFRNFVSEAKKKQNRMPDVLDTIAEHDEAQDRALEALRKWELRQQARKAGGRDERPASRDDPLRIPRPGEHHTEVRLPATRRVQQPVERPGPRPFEVAPSREAERTRREAYDAIRELLAGQSARAAPPARTRTDPPPEREPVPGPSAGTTRIRDRAQTFRPSIRGTVGRQTGPIEPAARAAETRRESSQAAPAGLGRLDSLSPLARGILYAELLGKPVAFRGPAEGDRD